MRCHPSLVLYFQSVKMASDHYMAVGLEQYIIDMDDEDCPEVGVHLAAWKGDAVQLQELLTCHKDHVQVNKPMYLKYAVGTVDCFCLYFKIKFNSKMNATFFLCPD